MMVSQRQPRSRVVHGPTPHSVAIFSREHKNKSEKLLLDMRRQEEARRVQDKLAKANELTDYKNKWQVTSERKVKQSAVKRKVASILERHALSMEDRRERLREMLSVEEEQYLAEMESKQETVLERQAKMRERAKFLKEKREKERLEVVQSKLEQQWRSQCEELRSTMSKRQQDEVAAERLDQLRIKALMEDDQQQEDKMYADLWYADMRAKAKREEAETKRQMSANQDTLNVLNKQIAAMELKREEEQRLKEEEANLLREQAELRKLEDMRHAEEKRNKQAQTRQIYSRSIRMKREKEARMEQEQLAFDLKILEKLLEDSRNEAMEQIQRKKELNEEDKRYRDFLRQLKLEEAAFERDLDKMIDVEVEKAWEKKMAQWRSEKMARKKLLEEVIAGRVMQVNDKLSANETRRAEALREKEDLMRAIKEGQAQTQAENQQKTQRHQAYQQDLLAQMDYNHRQRQLEWNEEARMASAQQDAEQEYRRKLEDALASDFVDKLHPVRRHAIGIKTQPASGNGGFVH